jgi:GAF domain-containing protein
MSEPDETGTDHAVDRVLDAVVEAAVHATGAAAGWLVGGEGDGQRVVAAGGGGAGELLGRRAGPGEGIAGFVVASGQPLALSRLENDPRLRGGVEGLLRWRPRSVLCVPCTSDDAVLGALELVDKGAGGAFTFDDLELVTLLAGIAGRALAADHGGGPVPTPAELGAELGRLLAIDPRRYRAVAAVISGLIAGA